MVNPEKVELMSKIALFEHSQGRKTLKLNNYFRSDFRTSIAMRSVPFGILTYLLLFVGSLLWDETWLVDLSAKVGIYFTAAIVLASLIVFVYLYCLVAGLVQSRQYENLRSDFREYSLNLRRLDRLYQRESAAAAEKMNESVTEL